MFYMVFRFEIWIFFYLDHRQKMKLFRAVNYRQSVTFVCTKTVGVRKESASGTTKLKYIGVSRFVYQRRES